MTITRAAPEDLAVKVAFLLRRAFAEPPEAIETHMSWVFLTSDRAYKLKKPVLSPYFDHRTVEARRIDCEAEVELNQALAPGVYLRSLPLTVDESGRLALGGEAEPVDWLVVMRRLPAASMLDRRLEAGVDGIEPAELEALVDHLVSFYTSTESVPTDADAYRAGLLGMLAQDRAELVRHDHALDKEHIEELTGELAQAIRTYPALDERSARVVDGHGDLRPEHVLVEPSPAVIDRITFDRDLRLVDPLLDLALLAVECEYLDASDLGQEITSAYLQRSGDTASPATNALYRALRATTRARLSVAHLADSDREAPKWLDRTDAYLTVAANDLALFKAPSSSPTRRDAGDR